MCITALLAPTVVRSDESDNRRTPAAALAIDSAGGNDALHAVAGEPIRMQLNLPGNPRWTEANIGHFIVRSGGVQRRVSPMPKPGTRYIEHTFTDPGWVLIVLDAGPAETANKSDSWQRTTHCTKMIFRVDDPAGNIASMAHGSAAGLTSKVGGKIEILPLASPPRLRVGSHLPLRAYFENSSRENARIFAHRPDGSVDTTTTGAYGMARFVITMPGRWLIRFQETAEDTTYTADLVFDVSAAGATR